MSAKSNFLALFFCLASLESLSQGVQFFNGDWNATLAKAQAENKPIYVDFYTTWCGPCKRMDAELFPNPEIGALMNANLIPVHIDAEKGEGIMLADKYQINSYPTSIYMNAYGEPFERMSGYAGLEGSKKMLVQAIEKFKTLSSKSTDQLKAEFEGGNRNFEFIKIYVARLKQTNTDAQPVIEQFVASLSDMQQADPSILLYLTEFAIVPDAPSYRLFHRLIEKDAFALTVQTLPALNKGIEIATKKAILDKNELVFKQINAAISDAVKFQEVHLTRQKVAKKYIDDVFENGEQQKFDQKFKFYLKTANSAGIANLIKEEAIKNFANPADLALKDKEAYDLFLLETANTPSDQKSTDFFKRQSDRAKIAISNKWADKYHSLSYLALTNTKDIGLFKMAETWAQMAFDVKKDDNFLFTIASLQEALGQKKKALATIKKALMMNPESNDYNEMALRLSNKTK